MPDLQTALQSALNQWEEPKEQTVQTQTALTQAATPKHYFSVTNNVSRVTFDYVRDNPGSRCGEVCDALAAQGFKRTSVSSLLGQMVLAKLLRRDDDRKYWAAKPEYEPFSTYTLRKERSKTNPRKLLSQTRAMKNYLPKKETPKAEPAQSAPQSEVKVVNSVDELIDTLTVAQARDLFARLKKMFA